MNRYQEALNSTFNKILDLRTENLTKISIHVGLTNVFNDLKANTDLIATKVILQGTKETGTTIEKEEARQLYIESIFINASCGSSRFYELGDMINHDKINFSENYLNSLKPADLVIAGDLVTQILTQEILNLTDSDVTVASIAEITTNKTAFLLLTDQPAELISKHSTNTKSVANLFKNGKKIIKFRLIKSLSILRKSDPELYNNFMNLTHVLLQGTHTHYAPAIATGTIKLQLIDILTLLPLFGISIRVAGFKEIYLSDESGMVEIELPIGTYQLQIMGFDHIAKTISVNVTEEDQTIDVQLTPVTV